MLSADFGMTKALMDSRIDGSLHKSEPHELLHQAGVEPGGWLAQQCCWLDCQFGHLLVARGKRLQQYVLPQATPLEG